MAAYPDESNPVRVMNELETRRLSIASAQKTIAHQSKQLKSDQDQNQLVFRHQTRILIVLLATLCLTLLIANSLALNFTVICMFEDESGSVESVNGQSSNQTDLLSKRRLLYSDVQTSWLFSAIAIGTIAGTLPISFLTNRFGFRKTFVIYGLTSAISTFLLPLAASQGFSFVMIVRMFQGFAIATSFPSMGSIVAEWATLKRSGTYFAYLSTHLQMGTILTMPLAGELCESRMGWPSLYYFLGTLTLLLFIMFFHFFRDSPAMHKNVSHKELTILQKNKVIRVMEKGEHAQIPYRSIFTDWAVVGIFASSIGGSLGFQLFFQYGPLYLNKILNFDVQNTGFAAALPSVLSMIVKFIAGPLSDNVPYLDDRWRMIMFASISQFAMAACFIALALIPAGWPILAQVAFTGATVFSGLNCVGVSKSAQMISGSFAYFVMAVLQFTMSFMTLILPLVVSVVAPENSREEWSRIFVFTGILLIIVTMIFNVTAEASPRPWTYADQTPSKLPDKVAPMDLNVPVVFDIPEEQLADVAQVDELLERKRMSIVSGGRNSNFGLFEVSLNSSDEKPKSFNV